MRYWDDFLSMLKDVKSHAFRMKSRIQPYRDGSMHLIGFKCEASGEIWQIDRIKLSESMEMDPVILDAILAPEGLETVSRAISKGFPADTPSGKFAEALDLIRDSDCIIVNGKSRF